MFDRYDSLIGKIISIHDLRIVIIKNKNRWKIIDEDNDEFVVQYKYDYPDCSEIINKTNNLCHLPIKLQINHQYRNILKFIKNKMSYCVFHIVEDFLKDTYTTTVKKIYCKDMKGNWLINSKKRTFFNKNKKYNKNSFCWTWDPEKESFKLLSL